MFRSISTGKKKKFDSQSLVSVINPIKSTLYMYCLVILYFLSDSAAGTYMERERF